MERQVEVEPYSFIFSPFFSLAVKTLHISSTTCTTKLAITVSSQLVAALFLPDQTKQAQGVHGALISPAGLGMLLLQHSKTLSGEEEWLFP